MPQFCFRQGIILYCITDGSSTFYATKGLASFSHTDMGVSALSVAKTTTSFARSDFNSNLNPPPLYRTVNFCRNKLQEDKKPERVKSHETTRPLVVLVDFVAVGYVVEVVGGGRGGGAVSGQLPREVRVVRQRHRQTLLARRRQLRQSVVFLRHFPMLQSDAYLGVVGFFFWGGVRQILQN